MNNEKFRKSLDEIKPSQALINKTLTNIKEKKKINFFMPFYMASLTAVCSIILVTTYIINDNSTTTNSVNNNFLIEIKGEYTFEHIFDFNVLSEDKFDNIYVLKSENKIEDNDYTIPYKYYVDIIETMKPLKDNKINTLKEFKEENYDKVVINDEKYFYISKEGYNMVYYDNTNKVYYQIETTQEQEENIAKIQNYIEMFSRMRSIENFIDQTYIKNVKQTSFTGMYLVEKTNRKGEWESYMKTREYSDYQELMKYIENLRSNKVTKTIDEFDVSKYYGNMLIQFEGFYMYIPETINGKILLYAPGWVHPIYYEIELQQKDYNTLESIKELIKTKGIYESAFDRYNPETKTYVDPYANESHITTPWYDFQLEKVWIKGGNNLYITIKADEIRKDNELNKYASMYKEDVTLLIEENIRSYTVGYYAVEGKSPQSPVIIYVTNDKKVKMLRAEDVIKTKSTNTAKELQINGSVKTVEKSKVEGMVPRANAILESGETIELK